ncbi:uncharacterized protein LOC103662305 isoform X1 [Ursus maritimus]|uniref:Uncharacterized protein LOC103662305 isoform X1 n=1 Tax=Ursus maritimus TaxID=29073 RepID=A0A384C009_URSMA|nr:uncharacterized protein LOC103662305 isoform X1 [Ursus maritimus]
MSAGWHGCLGMAWMGKRKASKGVMLDLPKNHKDGTEFPCVLHPASCDVNVFYNDGDESGNIASRMDRGGDWSVKEKESAEIGLSWEPSEERISCRRTLPIVSDAAESRLRPWDHVWALLARGFLPRRGEWPARIPHSLLAPKLDDCRKDSPLKGQRSLQSLPIGLAAIALGDDGSAEHSCAPGTMVHHARVVPRWLTGSHLLPRGPWRSRDLHGSGSGSSER